MKRIFLSFFLFILINVIIWHIISPLMLEPMIHRHLETELDQYYRQLIRGTYHVAIKDLNRVPPEQWPDHVAEMQQNFGYTIRLDNLYELELPEKDRHQLKAGEITVVENGEYFYQRLGQTDWVLTMVVSDFEASRRIEIKLEVLIWGTLVVMLGLMAMVWTLPFGLNLRRFTAAADAFGRGEFKARARVPKLSVLAPLASSFNLMAQRIQQLIDSHKELTRAVSHELRTPISRIRFSMEMVATASGSDERQEAVREIVQDVDELDTLVSELLVYARFDREKPELHVETLPVRPWLMALARTAEKDFQGIEFDHQLPAETADSQVAVDPRFMARAATNLIRNAARHAEKRVRVSFEQGEKESCIHVDDDGTGIPAADRQRIFEPFVRLDTSRSRDTGGYGLGLAIVKRVADWHNGRVAVSSSKWGGARFTICWPSDPPATD